MLQAVSESMSITPERKKPGRFTQDSVMAGSKMGRSLRQQKLMSDLHATTGVVEENAACAS